MYEWLLLTIFLSFPATSSLFTFSTLYSGHADLSDECQYIQSARMLTLTVWSCPKFTLDSTSSRPTLEITNCMLLLPFLFLFLVALYKKCFLFLFRYRRRCNDPLLLLSNDLYSGVEGGSLHSCFFKRIPSVWLHGRSFFFTRKDFLLCLFPLSHFIIYALGQSLI